MQKSAQYPRPWRIIKSQFDPEYPWLISRYTDDLRYEPVMRCATYASATSLVAGLIWLARNFNPASAGVSEGNPYVN